ncbi:MAG: DegV family protein [Clostridiales bacterium]|nr:DegV family protein [Clostridiales bacterium]
MPIIFHVNNMAVDLPYFLCYAPYDCEVFMSRYFVTTDKTCDLPPEISIADFAVIDMSYVMDGELYDGVEKPFLEPEEFYERLKGGSDVKTSLVPLDNYNHFFENILEKGYDILHICFSSALSGSFKNCLASAEQMKKRFPERKIFVVDSLSAGPGEGIMVMRAAKNRDLGMPIEQNFNDMEIIKYHIMHILTVDDMHHLYRGGRISKTQAILGTAVQLKPLIILNERGALENFGKAIGKKAAVRTIAEKAFERMSGYEIENDAIIISHCLALEDALYLKEKVAARYADKEIYIVPTSPIIGAHLGCGAVTIHFIGNSKKARLS